MARILVIEDDKAFCQLLAGFLRAHQFEVELAHDGEEGARRVLARAPDLVILDLMLPVRDGLAVCREVRPRYAGPILMLTARDEERDELRGFDHGVDDYLGKLTSPELILARVRALLRRQRRPAAKLLCVGPLTIDRQRLRVTAHGAPLDLTTAEFEMLHLLASRAGTPVSRDVLFRELRGIEYDGLDRAMDIRLVGLRKKLRAHNADCIKAVRGVGYQLVPGA